MPGCEFEFSPLYGSATLLTVRCDAVACCDEVAYNGVNWSRTAAGMSLSCSTVSGSYGPATENSSNSALCLSFVTMVGWDRP